MAWKNEGVTNMSVTLSDELASKVAEALATAIMEMNTRAQRSLTGLDKKEDDVRTELCVAASALLGLTIAGNVQRIGEIERRARELNPEYVQLVKSIE
jgi:hypothetical protein